MRVVLALAATFAALVAAGSAAAAQPPRDCVTAWNRGATPAQRNDVRHARRVQLTRENWGSGRCAMLYVLRSGKQKLAYGTRLAGPDGPTGVWTVARTIHAIGATPFVCTPNVRVLRDGTLVPL